MYYFAIIRESDDLIENIVVSGSGDSYPVDAGYRAVNITANREWHIGGALTEALEYTPPTPPEE